MAAACLTGASTVELGVTLVIPEVAVVCLDL